MGDFQHDDAIETSKGLLDFPNLPSSVAVHYSSSGMATPPLHALASVPFRWEEEPGKPRPCTDIIPLINYRRGLDPPPGKAQAQKLASPTTVLHSFESSSSGGGSPRSGVELKRNKWRGSLGFSAGSVCGRVMKKKKTTSRNGNGNGNGRSIIISTKPFWVSLCESLKQAMAWKKSTN